MDVENVAEKSNADEEFLVHDEWANEDVALPTKSDALMATFVLSTVADPFMIDKFLSLINNPAFNPAECTLHSVIDVHSFASDYRKDVVTISSNDTSSTTVPAFVWEEVILRIGAQWVAHASRIFDEATYENLRAYGDDVFDVIKRPHQSIVDLRCASLVHRSWTRPAQRQLGRVFFCTTQMSRR